MYVVLPPVRRFRAGLAPNAPSLEFSGLFLAFITAAVCLSILSFFFVSRGNRFQPRLWCYNKPTVLRAGVIERDGSGLE